MNVFTAPLWVSSFHGAQLKNMVTNLTTTKPQASLPKQKQVATASAAVDTVSNLTTKPLHKPPCSHINCRNIKTCVCVSVCVCVCV